MATITFKGNEAHTSGELPELGTSAPDFLLVNGKLENAGLAAFAGKRKLLNIVPSLDTSVCAISAKKFNEFAKQRDDVYVLVISADLPFAQVRFCGAEGVDNVVTLSMMRTRDFARDYGVLITDGPLAGVCARAVVVLDENDKVIYTQQVPDIGQEPDYEKAIEAAS